MPVAERIREIIKDKMLIQAEVGRRLGYTPKTFNSMLKGKRHIYADDIPKICRVLGISPTELYGYNETA